MTNEKGHIRRDIEKLRPGELTILGAIVTAMIAVVIAVVLEQNKAGTEIDPEKDVYLFLHGRTDLREKAETALVAYGFSKEKITVASSENIGSVGDYMAMLWMPPAPDHIIIQQITRVDEVEPEKIFGLWKGVSKKDIDTVSLEKDKREERIHRKGAKKRIFRPGLQDNQGLIQIHTEDVTPQKPVDFSKRHNYY
ncbi:MAG: hypothetical protein ACE5KZ_05925 [Candidatus Scalinduaceae bacterium]